MKIIFANKNKMEMIQKCLYKAKAYFICNPYSLEMDIPVPALIRAKKIPLNDRLSFPKELFKAIDEASVFDIGVNKL